MNDPRRSDEDAPISDDVAKRILARAAELDERRPDLTVAQLREAALEAGISEEAFDSAVGMVIPADAPPPPAPVRWGSKLRGLIAWSGRVGGAIGLASGALARLVPAGDAAFLLALGGGIGASLYLALRRRSGSRLGEFTVRTLLLWVYIVAGYIAVSGPPIETIERMLAVVSGFALSSLVIGGTIVRAGGPPDGDGDNPLPAGQGHAR